MPSFGEKLKQEREQRKITLEQISISTKIGTRMLQALEEDRFNQLPGGIFNKGFVRAYARCVGLDEDQTVAEYLEASGDAPPLPPKSLPVKTEDAIAPPAKMPRPSAASKPFPTLPADKCLGALSARALAPHRSRPLPLESSTPRTSPRNSSRVGSNHLPYRHNDHRGSTTRLTRVRCRAGQSSLRPASLR